jgi:predicted  nucleic acid-binding Zn-ribbon protein
MTTKMIRVDAETHLQLKEKATGTPLARYMRQIAGTDIEVKPDRIQEIAQGVIHNSGEIDKIESSIEIANKDINKLGAGQTMIVKEIQGIKDDIRVLKRNSDSLLEAISAIQQLIKLTL